MIYLHPEGIEPIVSLLLLLLYLQTRPGISCATQLRSIPFFFQMYGFYHPLSINIKPRFTLLRVYVAKLMVKVMK